MSYLSRVWVAASVSVVQGHTDQGFQWNSGLKNLPFNMKTFSSGFRPFSVVLGSDIGFFTGSGREDEKRQHADESLHHVMYLNCWGQS
ncbi:hypothetical protein HHK36_005454 [Tetracentron sinense]|uniref:Uncharacterized protein n=1 Tax=Tetracentron sinense TaxID=13715 RepID=A0A834ZKQ4_TETSI|nr:hypothetical protein HHK36_032080 [Tetracentron sinense]KAF8409379.1 hypothetical protein HHK36_005454 [Tetracentron sinense]